MNKRITLGAAITMAIMLATVTFIVTKIYAESNFGNTVFNIKERETMYSKLSEVDRLVRQNYYNTIDEDVLASNLVKGYVSGIEDVYGMYLTAEQYAETHSNLEGRMVDIGIVCSQDADGYILIDEVYPDSPASVSELMAGDLIIQVDELPITIENYLEAVDALKGEPGTTVTIIIRRDNTDTTYTIIRRNVEVPSVVSNTIQNIGYLKIKEFNDNTPAQFTKELDKLIASGVHALIFDVRNNPGGTIESASSILDTLLPEGPIIRASYRGDTAPRILSSSAPEEITLPMVVLMNAKSASDAELFAQALRDYNKAKLVGVTTYGKGSMQQIHKLSDGSALSLTIARFYPPFSDNFEGIGVKPDYEVALPSDLEKILDSLDEQSDLQLKKALEVAESMIKISEEEQPPQS